jgi:Uma2 family endonuclease
MSTAAADLRKPSPLVRPARDTAGTSAPQWFALENISWGTYELLARDLAGQHVRITYDDGRVVLMSPSPIHELIKGLIGRLIETAAFTRNLAVQPLGSTTWKRKDLSKALEADECYYVQNEARVRELTEFDLSRDPPPDLAIEIEATHHPLDRTSIYAKLGVNEVLRHDGERVEFLKLGPDGRYAPIGHSEAFPFLTPAIIDEHVAMLGEVGHTGIAQRFATRLAELPGA